MESKRCRTGMLLASLLLAVGVMIAPRPAHAEVDCWWSDASCAEGYECRWDSARPIHRCMLAERPPTAPAPRKGQWAQIEYAGVLCFVDDEHVPDEFCEDGVSATSPTPVSVSDASSTPAAPRSIAPTPATSEPTQSRESCSLDWCLECSCSTCLQDCKRRMRECREGTPSATPSGAAPAPTPPTPDCRRLVYENHPDCQP